MLRLSDEWKDYECLDAGNGLKLERWGDVILNRPDPQAIWNVKKDGKWDKSTCKISSCEDGYVVDFDNDECILNPCSPISPSSSSFSSSTSTKPAIGLVCVFLVALFHIFF